MFLSAQDQLSLLTLNAEMEVNATMSAMSLPKIPAASPKAPGAPTQPAVTPTKATPPASATKPKAAPTKPVAQPVKLTKPTANPPTAKSTTIGGGSFIGKGGVVTKIPKLKISPQSSKFIDDAYNRWLTNPSHQAAIKAGNSYSKQQWLDMTAEDAQDLLDTGHASSIDEAIQKLPYG